MFLSASVGSTETLHKVDKERACACLISALIILMSVCYIKYLLPAVVATNLVRVSSVPDSHSCLQGPKYVCVYK